MHVREGSDNDACNTAALDGLIDFLLVLDGVGTELTDGTLTGGIVQDEEVKIGKTTELFLGKIEFIFMSPMRLVTRSAIIDSIQFEQFFSVSL